MNVRDCWRLLSVIPQDSSDLSQIWHLGLSGDESFSFLSFSKLSVPQVENTGDDIK